MAASQPAGEPLPIDGLWETRAAPALEVRIEAARIFLARDANDGRPQGSLLYADLEQAGPLRFTCSRPLQRPGALDWQPCTLTLGEDGSLRAVTPDPEHPEHPLEQRFVAKTLSDETWFQAQIDSDEIVSAQDAHAPPPATEPVVVPPLPPAPGPSAVALPVPSPSTRFGRYRALVIGRAEYTYQPTLATAEGDAAAVSDQLESRYGFDVVHLRNPSLADLSQALERLERELSDDDNLLLYWAGHGFMSDELGRCTWFPVEAFGDDASQGLTSDDLAAALRRMKAKHVLVVADSCFTASQPREVGLRDEEGDVHGRLSELRTRVVLSSGGLEPIQDGQGTGHSTFTGAFLSALSANGEVLDGQSLFSQIQQIVTASASQKPEYANILGADHDGGDFLFVPTP